MGLVIGVGEGDSFRIGARRYTVREVFAGEGLLLEAEDGARFEVNQAVPTQVAPEVTVIEGLRVNGSATRLKIDAPRSILLERETGVPVKPPSDVALLAPVPAEHLDSAAETCAREGKVAFGTRANFERLHSLPSLADAAEVSVFIYASGAASGPPQATWTARFVGLVASRAGAHPDGMKYRRAPRSTRSTTRVTGSCSGRWPSFAPSRRRS